MKNLFAKKDWSAGNVLNLIWLLLSIPFVLYALYQFGLSASYNAGMQAGGQQGIVKAYTDVFQVANNKECAPFPITLGQNKVDLINVACLTQAPAEETSIEELAE